MQSIVSEFEDNICLRVTKVTADVEVALVAGGQHTWRLGTVREGVRRREGR